MSELADDVLKGKYPAKAHVKKVVEYIKAHGGEASGVIYLEGQKTKMNEDNDQEAPFRQRRYFYYLTGCELPDCYFTYDIAADKSTLFIPPINPEEVVWSGLPMTTEEALKKYDVDAVLPSTEVNGYLASSETPKSTVFAIPGQVSDHITFLPFGETKFDFLKPAIEECRVRKTPYEIALIRAANTVSTAAHTAVMRAVSHATNERELEAIFLKTCIERGCRNQAYSSIVASGTSAATLHYVRNDQPLSGKLNLLLDAGAELECYASDITRTFPINGRFTQESREIFDIVLEMQRSCIEMLRAGVVWDDVHAHAHKIAIDGLGKLGILQGLTEEIFNARTSVAFFPHGLGHYLGMDTHDTGGHANYQDKDPMFRYLRVRGEVPAGAVITVEPGIYFCRFIVEPYLEDEKHAKYIDREVLERYWEVGGVRIEGKYLTSFPSGLRGGFVLGFQRQCADIVADNVLITEEGYENLTDTPKQADEMERFIMG